MVDVMFPLEVRDLDDRQVLVDPASLPSVRENGDTLVNGVDEITVVDNTAHTITGYIWWGSWHQKWQADIATVSGANDAAVAMTASALAFGTPTMQVHAAEVPADVLTESGGTEPLYSSTSPTDFLTES